MNLSEEIGLVEPVESNKSSYANFKILLKSNLDFNNHKNEQGSKHAWHAFPAKFPPQIPNLFIKHLTKKDDLILDPMMGSCTTLLEARQLERKTIGFDIDPLALINGKAKFEAFNSAEAIEVGKSLIERAITSCSDDKALLKGLIKERFDEETREFIDYWFLKNTQLELIAILCEIEKIKNEALRVFYTSVFSSIIITKSGGVTLALDLAHTRPHKKEDKKINSAFSDFLKRLYKNLKEDKKLSLADVNLEEANAKELPLKSNSVDLIVTSPPYANNAIDYMRAHKFSLVWFGYSITKLKGIRKKFIGSEIIKNSILNDLPKFSSDKVFQLASLDMKRGKDLHHYYSEMTSVLKEMFRVLKPNRACVVVVASSVLKGIDVETHKCLAEIGQQAGFDLVHIGERHIDRNKRMMPISHIKNSSQIESRMHNEYVLGFWKK